MTLSTIEAKFIACVMAINESLWLKGITRKLMVTTEDTLGIVYCENHSTIHLTVYLMFHSRSKHSNMKFHVIRDNLTQSLVRIEKVATKN